MAELGLESWQIGFRIHAVYLLIQTLDQNLDPSSWRSVSGFNKWVPTAILWSQFCQAAAIQNTLTSCPHKGTWVGPIKCSLTWNVPAHISLLSVLVYVILNLPAFCSLTGLKPYLWLVLHLRINPGFHWEKPTASPNTMWSYTDFKSYGFMTKNHNWEPHVLLQNQSRRC